MIRSIKLKNYRCFENAELSFKKITLIVGSNNAGKSTITEALRIIGLAVRKFQNGTYVEAPKELELPAAVRGIILHVEDLRIDLRTIVYYYKEDVPAEITAYFDNNTIIHIYLTSQLVFAQITSNRKTITRKAEAKKIQGVDLHIMPQIGLIQEDEKRLAPETVTRDIETRLSSRHFRNEIYQYRDEYFDVFRETAQRTWPGLRIQGINYELADDYITLLVNDDGYSAEIGLMGSGLQMWLQIVWFISRDAPDATVVLDEPDVYMHPDLQRRILNIVKRKFKQVIIATHSVEIMAGVEPEQIVTVDKTTRKMKYASSYSAVQDVISNLGSIHNLSLAKIGTARKCVFVEGKDIKTLSKLQNICDIDNNLSVDQLPVVELGGWSRFNEALGAARLFFQETSGEIKTYCILDRDYHTKEEIDSLYARAEENHLLLHVWEKKELENYLLSPDSLFRLTELPDCNYEEFLTDLYNVLDSLYDKTLDSIMDYLQSIDPRKKGPSHYKKAAEMVLKEPWATLTGRISIVNGKDMISLINTWMKKKYNKSCSRSKLIQSLQSDNISEEVKTEIRQLLGV